MPNAGFVCNTQVILQSPSEPKPRCNDFALRDLLSQTLRRAEETHADAKLHESTIATEVERLIANSVDVNLDIQSTSSKQSSLILDLGMDLRHADTIENLRLHLCTLRGVENRPATPEEIYSEMLRIVRHNLRPSLHNLGSQPGVDDGAEAVENVVEKLRSSLSPSESAFYLGWLAGKVFGSQMSAANDALRGLDIQL